MNIIKKRGRVYAVCLLVILSVPTMSSISFPFPYKGLEIKMSGTISEMYDDNIHSDISENKKEDFITRLGLGVGVRYEDKKRILDIEGKVNQSIFAKYNELNRTSQNLTLNFQNDFSEYDRISLNNVFTHTYEPSGFEEAFGKPAGRYSSYKNIFNLLYTRDLTKKLSLTARYSDELNWSSWENLKDSVLYSVGLAAGYSFSPATTFSLFYNFTRSGLENVGDAFTHTTAMGVRRYITKRFYFDGKAGIDFINNFEDEKEKAQYFDISFTGEVDENTVATISFTKRKRTVAYREDFFDSWQTSTSLTKDLTKRLRCFISGFYGSGAYSNGSEKFQGLNISFTYEFLENLKGNLMYNYSKKDSTALTETYTKNTLLVGLNFEF